MSIQSGDEKKISKTYSCNLFFACIRMYSTKARNFVYSQKSRVVDFSVKDEQPRSYGEDKEHTSTEAVLVAVSTVSGGFGVEVETS